MTKLANTGKWLYASALCVFGIQHFIYAQFVATLVPAWLPWHPFFVCLTAVAFIATALSIVINKYVRLSCILLSLMLALFIVLLHIPKLYHEPQNPQAWTRALQDVVIMGTALILSGDLRLQPVGKYLFAAPMMLLGLQHFTHAGFVTARVPAYLPGIAVWDYLFGIFIIVAAIGIVSNRYAGAPAVLLGLFLVTAALLYHVPLLIANVNSGVLWTAAMLDLAITGGAFTVAAMPATQNKAFKIAAR